MIEYDLKSMMKTHGKGVKISMPVIPESLGFRRSYLAELRRFLNTIAKATRETIIPAYRREILLDATESDFEALRNLVRALLLTTTDSVRRLILLEATKHTEKFAATARSAFGVNLAGVIAAEDLENYIDRMTLRNAALIKGMGDDLIKNIQMVTTDALINGKTAAQLRSELKEKFELSDSRAKLIARDQTSKLNANLNKIRQQQAGVNRYTWRTSQDERVREDHKKVNGKVYEYGEPTGVRTGAEPGQDIQCRCIAQGLLEF